MNCAQIRNLLHAFLDGELDLVRHLEVEHHLAECTACAEEHDGLRALSTALKADALYFRAPPGLSERVRSSLRRAPVPEPSPVHVTVPWRRYGIAAGLAAAVVVLVGGLALLAAGLLRSTGSAEERLAQEIVSGHVRSLLANHLTDVSSSDRHTVKPWFKGKVDFAPPVCDLGGQDFALVGGRLDYLDDRLVVALVYQRRQHVINLFLWPSGRAPEHGPTSATRNGYQLVSWTTGGMNWWAVSDLNAKELREFVELVQSETRPGGP